jgi:MerR family transcriptional regulator, thiopeptide resistance regulator
MAYPPVNRPEGLLDRLVPTTYGEERRGEWSEQIRGEEREMADRMVRLAELMVAGKPPHDPAVLHEIDWYYRAANQYGGVNAATFTALGDALVDNEQSRAVFDDVVEGLAAYQRDAMTVYAQARLSMGGA